MLRSPSLPKMRLTLFFRGLARLASGDAPGSKADFVAARAINPKIDAQFADYGLIAPKGETAAPTQRHSRARTTNLISKTGPISKRSRCGSICRVHQFECGVDVFQGP